VAEVQFRSTFGTRLGVASGQLCRRIEPGAELQVYVQRNEQFRLPEDPATPVIMIGAGTGVAPYRAFMQQREMHGAAGRAWLFFGERRFRTDFLYQTEWQRYLKDGLLTRMEVAFSRDQAEKVYVQQRLRECGRELYAWLEQGACIYVCGDAESMAPDVHAALIDIIATHGGRDAESAREYLNDLTLERRYRRDVY
jgi:sulfite reductase (NADPH) flavoprotein alpha-component